MKQKLNPLIAPLSAPPSLPLFTIKIHFIHILNFSFIYLLSDPSAAGMLQYMPPPPTVKTSYGSGTTSTSSNSGSTATLFASLFSSATASTPAPSTNFTELIGSMNRPELPSLCLSTNAPNLSIFSPPPPAAHQFAAPPSPPSAHMSATALLQKAAQMGAAATTSSFLKGFGLATSSSSSSGNNNNNSNNHDHYHHDGGGLSWGHHHHQKLEHEPPMLSAGLGLGLAYENGSGLPDLMMGSSALFGPKPATLDLLGLGIGPGGSATGGLSALMTSIGGGLDVGPGGSQGPSWEGADRKSSSSAIL